MDRPHHGAGEALKWILPASPQKAIENADVALARGSLCQTPGTSQFTQPCRQPSDDFRFRGGDPETVRASLERLFKEGAWGSPVTARVDEA